MADKLELMKRSFAKIKYSMPPRHATDNLAEQMCELSDPHSWPRIKDGALACLLTHLLLKVFFFSCLRQNAIHPSNFRTSRQEWQIASRQAAIFRLACQSFISAACTFRPDNFRSALSHFLSLNLSSSVSFVRSFSLLCVLTNHPARLFVRSAF